jgi:16S rRNA (guanine966-N2)-methyltransferase
MGKIRIIAGNWRGRKLDVPNIANLRPTPDRVRETLFNWLQPIIEGSHCLDLYAGTGVLGLEAKSRGAASVVFVEHDSLLVKQLRSNVDLFSATDIQIEQADAQHWVQETEQKFDTVFLDPPFGQGLIEKACALLLVHDCLYPKAWVYIEGEKGMQVPAGFTVKNKGTAGHVNYMLLQSE